MVRKLKYVSIVIVITLCATALVYGPKQPAAQAQRHSTPSQSDEAQAATILLEAFVIEVNLPALEEMGVSPIGQPPHNVRVENILGCIEKGQAHVIAGAKEAVQDQKNNRIRATHTTYVKRNLGQRKDYTPYEMGTALEATIALLPEGSVEVSYSLSCSIFQANHNDQDVPPDTNSWDWQGSILLTPGEPAIAAADQNDQRAIFVLLTAHVRNQ